MLKQGMRLKHKNRFGVIEIIETLGWLDHARLKLPTGDELNASIDAIIGKLDAGDYVMVNDEVKSTSGLPVAVRIGDTTELESTENLTHEDSANIFAQALSWLLKPNEGISIKVGPKTYSVINDSATRKIMINKIDGNMPDGQMLWTGSKPIEPDDDED